MVKSAKEKGRRKGGGNPKTRKKKKKRGVSILNIPDVQAGKKKVREKEGKGKKG